MKKTIYMSMALCLLSIAAFAQVTEKTIEGDWKLHAMKFSGLYYEIHTGRVELPETIDGMPYHASDEVKQSLAQQLKEQTASFKDSYINLQKEKVKSSMGGIMNNGVYKLTLQGNESILEFTYADGETQKQSVYIDNGSLYLIQDDKNGNTVTLTFIKA